MSELTGTVRTGGGSGPDASVAAPAIEVIAGEGFEALVRHSYDALVLADERNVIGYVTPAVQRLFGWDPDELVGRDGFEFVHPDDRRTAVAHATEVVSRPDGHASMEMRLRTADGDHRWVECTSVNLLSHPQVRAVVNSFRDIQDRREAEQALRASEERLSALLRNADGAIIVSDDQGRATWASPGASALWGWPPESLLGRAMAEHLHPADRDEVARQYRKVLATAGASARAEARMRHADGSWRWYESIFTNCLDDPAVGGIVANVRDTTERALAEQALRDSEARLDYQATHDVLTDLPNRTLLFDRLEVAIARAVRNGTTLAVLFTDLDHFKVVNDSRGHAFGDEVLQVVARRLREAVRPGDTVARFGGDEFVVVSEDLAGPAEASGLAERIARSLERPVPVGEGELFLTASVGVATTDGLEATPEAMLRDADAAMYQAKDRGRARHEVFDDGMRSRALDRHQLENALRRAVARRHLLVHYQPVVELASGRIRGVEALLRWHHPDRGLLFPGTFIAIAEETGLIVPLGAWVFDEACHRVSRLAETVPDQPLRVGINLSARQLADPSLTDDIANVLAATPIDPRHVHVEVTESVVMRDVEASLDLLARLKVLGVRVAIDDFGTGYSSFAYLSRLPVDILKIDRSFIGRLGREGHADAIVAALVDLGHTLGLEVVAEGIETPEQLQILRELGCDEGQGFWFSGAVPPAAIGDLLRAEPRW